jgi:D-threo-aldose 1-dehydrogenase
MSPGHFAPPGPLGFGTAPLGNLFARVPDEVAAATLHAAWNCGIRFFDTAPFYGFGLAEHRLGEALRGRPRDEYVLCSKVGRLLDPDGAAAEERFNFFGGLPFQPRFDYTPDGILRSIEHSLQRLGVARLDIVLVHDLSEDTHGPGWRELFDRSMPAAGALLSRLREEGVIRGWGLGSNMAQPCLLALEQCDPDVFLLAGRYTLLETRPLADLFPRCAARGVHVVVGGPYNSGLLAGGTTFDYAPASTVLLARVQALRAVCDAHGVGLKAAALQFCAAHPVVAAVIPGGRSVIEVQQNAALMTAPIPSALWQDLRARGLLAQDAPMPD